MTIAHSQDVVCVGFSCLTVYCNVGDLPMYVHFFGVIRRGLLDGRARLCVCVCVPNCDCATFMYDKSTRGIAV